MADLILHLVRHGTHCDHGLRLSGRRSNAPLEPEGWQQAAAVARHFAAAGRVDVVQSSPRLRARQTASVIEEHLRRPCEIACGWDEIDYGAWTGREFDSLVGDPRWDRWNTARATTCPPEGESIAAVVSRVMRQIQALRRRATDTVAVCVTHCDVIRSMVTSVLRLDPTEMLTFDVDTGSVTSFLFDGSGGHVQSINRRFA